MNHGELNNEEGLQFFMETLEQACKEFQKNTPGADSQILRLMNQVTCPYRALTHIIGKSQLGYAKFLAATVLRDVAIKEWGSFEHIQKKLLISFCLAFLFQHSTSVEGYVLKKIASVAAQFLKRSWLDLEVAETDSFLSKVNQSVLGTEGVMAQLVGLYMMESMVSEFSISTSTSMGLPRKFHEQCQDSFELDYLQQFYCWAKTAASGVEDKIINHDSEILEFKVCASALNLMCQILSWDFQFNTNVAEGSKNKSTEFRSKARKSAVLLTQPGSHWHGVLLSSGHIKWLLRLYQGLRQKFSDCVLFFDSVIAEAARKLIIQLCSLTGTIYPSDDGVMQEKYLSDILSGIIPWVHPEAIADATARGRTSEVLDGCRVLLTIANLTTPLVFDNMLKPISCSRTFELTYALTLQVLNERASSTDEETWSWIAWDILLETWTKLLEQTCTIKSNAPEGINAAAATVFEMIVQSELSVSQTAAQASKKRERERNKDKKPKHQKCPAHFIDIAMDERLSSYALIARVAVERSIPFLTEAFRERFEVLEKGEGKTCTIEELYFLLLLTGHVLADPVEGEIPLVPEAFNSLTEQHPVVSLSRLILDFVASCIHQIMRDSFVSPRLMEALVWFLARWSDTYLMPPKRDNGNSCNSDGGNERQCISPLSSNALFAFCFEHDLGKHILDVIVWMSSMILTKYPEENNLQALTCYQLLPALVRRRNVCVHLFTLDSWKNFEDYFASEVSLFSLAAPYQHSLGETLIRAAICKNTPDDSYEHVMYLVRELVSLVVDSPTRDDPEISAQWPGKIKFITSLFERLRGAAKATHPRTQMALYAMGAIVMKSILRLLEIYEHESAVVYVLLKFVVGWVRGQLCFLEAKKTSVVLNFCLDLLNVYPTNNIGKISGSPSSSLRSEETAKYKNLRALLQLLTNLCSKDKASSDSNNAVRTDIKKVVYLGLNKVAPLISLELLKFPKLCHSYFELFSHILEVYPEKITELNADMLAQLVWTLDFDIYRQRLGYELIHKQTIPELKTRLVMALEAFTSSNNLSLTLDRMNYQNFRKKSQHFFDRG